MATPRIAIVKTERWTEIIEKFKEQHPSRTWPDATIIDFLAELGWSVLNNSQVVLPASNPPHVTQPQPTYSAPPVPSAPSKVEALPSDDGFPLMGVI